jgi:transmembrane sensor
MNQHEQSDERLTIATEAAQWLGRMKTADAHERRALLLWLRRSPEHVRELFLAARTDFELREFFRERTDDAATSPGSDVIELPAPQSLAWQARRWPRNWTWAAGASIAAAVAILALLIVKPVFLDAWLDPNVYVTSSGERRAVELADGSAIVLNAGSRVQVSFSKKQRDAYLVDGQAMFSVVSDRMRPFRVHVGSSIVQAVGTKFDVQRHAKRFDVAVIEGAVQVGTGTSGAYPSQLANPTRVAKGEGVSVAATGAITAPVPIDIAKVSAWRQLIFRDKPLGEVVEEFARYNKKLQWRVEGAELQALLVSGVYDADEPEELLHYLEGGGTIAIERNGKEVVIRMRSDLASQTG